MHGLRMVFEEGLPWQSDNSAERFFHSIRAPPGKFMQLIVGGLNRSCLFTQNYCSTSSINACTYHIACVNSYVDHSK